MSETILGFPGLTEQGRKYTRDPVRGLTTEILYEGPKDAILAALYGIPATVHHECDTLRPGPVGTLYLRSPDYGDPSDSEVQTSYDLLPNVAQRIAYENPRVAALGTDVIALVKNIVRGAVTLSTPITGANAALLTTVRNVILNPDVQPTTELTTNAKALYEYIIGGADTFFASEVVFRITDVIANGREHAIAYSNSNRIYTSAQLIAETNPTQFYQNGIEAAETMVRTDIYGGPIPAGLLLGWLKHMPGTANVPGNRSAVTVEYWLGAWPTLYYPAKA